MADYGYMLKTTWVSEATITADSTANIESWVAGASAGFGKRPDWYWHVPDKELTTRARRPQTVKTLGRKQRVHGDYFFQWGWKFMPENAVSYALQKMGFSSPYRLYDETEQSVQVTVRHHMYGWWNGASSYTSTLPLGIYKTFQCWVHRPIAGQDYKACYGGVENIVFRFSGGTIV